MKKGLVSYIGVRVTKETHTAFIRKSREVSRTTGMDSSDVLRNLIQSFIEGRLTIKPAQMEIQNETV